MPYAIPTVHNLRELSPTADKVMTDGAPGFAAHKAPAERVRLVRSYERGRSVVRPNVSKGDLMVALDDLGAVRMLMVSEVTPSTVSAWMVSVDYVGAIVVRSDDDGTISSVSRALPMVPMDDGGQGWAVDWGTRYTLRCDSDGYLAPSKRLCLCGGRMDVASSRVYVYSEPCTYEGGDVVTYDALYDDRDSARADAHAIRAELKAAREQVVIDYGAPTVSDDVMTPARLVGSPSAEPTPAPVVEREEPGPVVVEWDGDAPATSWEVRGEERAALYPDRQLYLVWATDGARHVCEVRRYRKADNAREWGERYAQNSLMRGATSWGVVQGTDPALIAI